MAGCSARITHSEKTIKSMAQAQYDAFRPASYYVMLVVSLGFLAAGVFAPSLSQGIKILFLVIGSFTIVSLNAPARQLAEQVIKSLNGRYPKFEYRFGEASVQLTGSEPSAELRYGDVIRLHEDAQYLYLFIENKSAYMLDKKTVKPDMDTLKSFISGKTGLQWTRRRSMLNTSLKSLRYDSENTRRSEEGPRLKDRH